jgi:hypothetical protein
MKPLLYAVILFIIGQSMIWLQTNGQFFSDWMKKNPIIVSILGAPIAYLFIKANYFSNQYFGNLWGGRMIGFTMGILTFTILTWIVMNEPLDFKTLLTIILAFGIIMIQLFL